MDLGVSFEKNISIGWWVRNTVLNPFGGMLAEAKKNPLMPHRIGGYAKETINEALRCKKEGFDGILQLFPVGCMPEIVAKSVFDGLAKMKVYWCFPLYMTKWVVKRIPHTNRSVYRYA